jgi:hypothetical protein
MYREFALDEKQVPKLTAGRLIPTRVQNFIRYKSGTMVNHVAAARSLVLYTLSYAAKDRSRSV